MSIRQAELGGIIAYTTMNPRTINNLPANAIDQLEFT